ncbi:MAG: sulfatase-like hydrolase/transferase [Phycisphaeraceae bacterium]
MKTLSHRILLLTLMFGLTATISVKADDRPNVILMMADDLANEDLSCYGSTRIKTPNIDKLAGEGLKLTSYYAGNPVCSPSRMALLSGSYPARLGWRWGVLGYGFAPKTGMSPKVYTIAEAFRDGGYRTAMTGKWHLGVQNMSPEKQGFDSTYYIRMSNNQDRDMFRDGKLVKEKWDNALLSETFTEEAIRVISEQSDKPFFLYVPWSAPHFPADPHPDWLGKSGTKKSGKYTDTVEELDHRIGQVLSALDKAGKTDNTIVIFTSDNGRQSGQQGPNDDPPFSGMKWHSLEGGTRVPCIVRYPGKVAKGQSSAAMISAMDLYPTLAHACGVEVKLPEGAQKMDGVNVWGTFANHFYEHPRTELLYWHGKGQATAIRIQEWKLYFNKGDKGDPDTSKGPLLFNLNQDPKESADLAGKNPEKVKQMLTRAKALLADVYNNQVQIGTWPGVEPPEKPLKAEDVGGQWLD